MFTRPYEVPGRVSRGPRSKGRRHTDRLAAPSDSTAVNPSHPPQAKLGQECKYGRLRAEVSRQFVFIYRGRLDLTKYTTARRLRAAGEFLLLSFNKHTAAQHVLDDDTKVQVNEANQIIELGCTLLGVGSTEEDELVEYLSSCVRMLNGLDDQTLSQLVERLTEQAATSLFPARPGATHKKR